MAVSCYPTPAVCDWPSGFNVLNQYDQENDVTFFELSVPVTDDVMYTFTGQNGHNGQLSAEFTINVIPAGTFSYR